uniref:Uncharacterized protein n=1 Tax=Heterorhabditis bacteriophora TaxID=37862 RepID=A0A1I7X3G9_HETBA
MPLFELTTERAQETPPSLTITTKRLSYLLFLKFIYNYL